MWAVRGTCLDSLRKLASSRKLNAREDDAPRAGHDVLNRVAAPGLLLVDQPDGRARLDIQEVKCGVRDASE